MSFSIAAESLTTLKISSQVHLLNFLELWNPVGETRALMFSAASESHPDRPGQQHRKRIPPWPERQGTMEAYSPEDVSASTSGGTSLLYAVWGCRQHTEDYQQLMEQGSLQLQEFALIKRETNIWEPERSWLWTQIGGACGTLRLGKQVSLEIKCQSGALKEFSCIQYAEAWCTENLRCSYEGKMSKFTNEYNLGHTSYLRKNLKIRWSFSQKRKCCPQRNRSWADIRLHSNSRGRRK